MSHEMENLGLDSTLGDARERDFGIWVSRRLSHWPLTRILAFERWLLEEGQLEFLPAVRDALLQRASAA